MCGNKPGSNRSTNTRKGGVLREKKHTLPNEPIFKMGKPASASHLVSLQPKSKPVSIGVHLRPVNCRLDF